MTSITTQPDDNDRRAVRLAARILSHSNLYTTMKITTEIHHTPEPVTNTVACIKAAARKRKHAADIRAALYDEIRDTVNSHNRSMKELEDETALRLKCGTGSSHIWVSFEANDDRILLITQ